MNRLVQSPVPSPQSLVFALCIALLAISATAGPVSHFGYLKTCKNGSNQGRICGSYTNSEVMVKGPSLFWSAGAGTTFYNRETVDWFVNNMQIGVIRAAMAIKYYKENAEGISKWDPDNKTGCESCFGYLSDINHFPNAKIALKASMQNMIDAAVANDIYVIIDWHSHNANSEQTEAEAFFRDMANANRDVPNIIWEIYNEPVRDNANTIRNYANGVISAIRGTGNENLIIVGSTDYSKDPNGQRQNAPTDSKNNTAYSFHFYSNTHGQGDNIGTSATNAMSGGASVFATEWGSVDASGGGTPNANGAAPTWYNWMNTNNISSCYWSASDINEGASIFKNGTDVSNLLTSPANNLLTASGNVFNTFMSSGKDWKSFIPAGNPKGNDVFATLNEGGTKTWTTELGLTGTITDAKLIDGTGDVSFTGTSITYTSLPFGSSNQAYIAYTVRSGTKDIKQRAMVTLQNFKPILPKQEPRAVSRRAPNYITIRNLGAIDKENRTLSFSAVSANNGGSAKVVGTNSDNIEFTPPASIADADLTQFELTYTVKNTSNLTSTQTITLNAQNMVPTARVGDLCCNVPNTAPYDLSVQFLGGSDLDDDPLTIVAYYLPDGYPGTLEKIAPDMLRYTPEPGKIGTIRILSVFTDGYAESNIGNIRVNLTGSGTSIPTQSPPNEIPGYTPPDGTPIKPIVYANSAMSLQALAGGRLLVNFAEGGNAELLVFSLSGKLVANLLQGSQSAGSREFNLGNLQKGLYIVRLKQGSEIRTLKVIN